MLVNFQTILKDADEKGYAVPAFNVYNMETVMGVIQAAEEQRSPVIIQFYSRLATTGFADYLAPVILKAAEKATVPVCMHLDHGAGYEAAAIALKNGATGIMVDFSQLSLEENIEKTAKAVHKLSQKYNVEMPISEQAYMVLFEDYPVKDCVTNLMSRETKNED